MQLNRSFLVCCLLSAFNYLDAAVEPDYEKDFWTDKELNCDVVGESKDDDNEGNPDYCWAFAYKKGNRSDFHENPKKLNYCETAKPNDEVPDSLKGIVEVKNDGV